MRGKRVVSHYRRLLIFLNYALCVHSSFVECQTIIINKICRWCQTNLQVSALIEFRSTYWIWCWIYCVYRVIRMMCFRCCSEFKFGISRNFNRKIDFSFFYHSFNGTHEYACMHTLNSHAYFITRYLLCFITHSALFRLKPIDSWIYFMYKQLVFNSWAVFIIIWRFSICSIFRKCVEIEIHCPWTGQRYTDRCDAIFFVLSKESRVISYFGAYKMEKSIAIWIPCSITAGPNH